MKHAVIENIPTNPKTIYDTALSKAFEHWIDEKGTKDNPGIWKRQASKLSYEEAFKIIQENKPHWVISFRNQSYLNPKEKDYWEFGGCNIASNDYGEVFIWINLEVEVAEKLFEEFGLKVKEY